MMMTETTKAATTTAIDADTNVKLWNNFSLWTVVVCAIIKRACVCISILCTRISLAYSQKQQLLLQPLKANLVLFYVCIWQWVCVCESVPMCVYAHKVQQAPKYWMSPVHRIGPAEYCSFLFGSIMLWFALFCLCSVFFCVQIFGYKTMTSAFFV